MIFRVVFIAALWCLLASAHVTGNSLRLFQNVYEQCASTNDLLRCLKIQALKVVGRALQSKALTIVDGVTLVSANDSRSGRTFSEKIVSFNDTKLEKLNSTKIDELILEGTTKFLDTHKLQITIPELVEEGRKKKHRHHGHAALLWALAIKGSFLAMAYNGIAVMAGTALIVGKMALLLSAILGLKKLVSSGHEKSTIEIVKVPKHSETYAHSTAYEDDSHYRRSFNKFDPDFTNSIVYNRQVPEV